MSADSADRTPSRRADAGRAPRRCGACVAGCLRASRVLIAGAVFMLLPLVFMLVSSIKPPAEIFEATFSLWPRKFYGVENFTAALTTAPLLRFLLNGVDRLRRHPGRAAAGRDPVRLRAGEARLPRQAACSSRWCVLGLCIPVQAPALPLYIALRASSGCSTPTSR